MGSYPGPQPRGWPQNPLLQSKSSPLLCSFQLSPITWEEKTAQVWWDNLHFSFKLEHFWFGHSPPSLPPKLYTSRFSCERLRVCACWGRVYLSVWIRKWIMLSENTREALGARSNIFPPLNCFITAIPSLLGMQSAETRPNWQSFSESLGSLGVPSQPLSLHQPFPESAAAWLQLAWAGSGVRTNRNFCLQVSLWRHPSPSPTPPRSIYRVSAAFLTLCLQSWPLPEFFWVPERKGRALWRPMG